MSGLNLNDKATEAEIIEEPLKTSVSREKILEEAKHVLDAENQNGKKGISIVVIGESSFFFSGMVCGSHMIVTSRFRSCRCW